MSPLVDTEVVGRVLVATLARPPVNALNDRMIAALDAVVDRAIADAGIGQRRADDGGLTTMDCALPQGLAPAITLEHEAAGRGAGT